MGLTLKNNSIPFHYYYNKIRKTKEITRKLANYILEKSLHHAASVQVQRLFEFGKEQKVHL